MFPKLLSDILVLTVLASVVGITFSGRIVRNFGQPHWEDKLFFGHVERMDSIAETFRHGSYWKGLYRPLSTNLYYYVGHRVFAHHLPVYHALNVASFLMNALLAFWVCRSFASVPASLAVAALFGSRLASTEVLLYTSQMQSLLPVFFALLGLKAYLAALKRRYQPGYAALAALCVLLGLFSKESIVVLPLIFLLFALVWVHEEQSPRAPLRRKLAVVGLPLLSVVLWQLVGHQFLMVGNNPWWQYEYDPMEIAGNYIAYLLSFVNLLVWPVPFAGPTVGTLKLNVYPTIMAARGFFVLRVAFLLASAGCAMLIVLVGVRRNSWRPPEDVRWAAVGFAIFGLAMAPTVIFKDRLYMYYGYFGHFGLSLLVVASFRLLADLRRGTRPAQECRPEPQFAESSPLDGSPSLRRPGRATIASTRRQPEDRRLPSSSAYYGADNLPTRYSRSCVSSCW